MATTPTSFVDEISIALGNLANAATGAVTPTLRLGVTGLSRAGKTIFITALIHNLLTNGRLAGFSPLSEGRFIGARLEEHPDKAMPRFAYEQHLGALTGQNPHWPQSTRSISQIRIKLKFQSANWLAGIGGPSTLNLDIVDYPGEWLLDLPLLSLSFAQWSEQALERATRTGKNNKAAKALLKALDIINSETEATESLAEELASTFTRYLRASRADAPEAAAPAKTGPAMSALPPGRFLLPGDMEGSPALTFAPLPLSAKNNRAQSLYAMMARRYEAYKALVVRPFFRDHFARLDRQIVLVDALRALNAGPAALSDLQDALTSVLACFRQGANSPLSWILARKIDRILFAATKADHVHHTSHDRLEQVLNRLVAQAARNARFSGAETRSIALASVRATKEGTISDKGQTLDCLIGTPLKGEVLDKTTYDGKTEIALFPGDLPQNPESVFQPGFKAGSLQFLRFSPPLDLEKNAEGAVRLPHIRLDRALDFLLSDWMK
jgi:uncharacterized protein